MHNGVTLIGKIAVYEAVIIRTFYKIAHLVFFNILEVNGHILVSVRPGLGVDKTQAMQELVLWENREEKNGIRIVKLL